MGTRSRWATDHKRGCVDLLVVSCGPVWSVKHHHHCRVHQIRVTVGLSEYKAFCLRMGFVVILWTEKHRTEKQQSKKQLEQKFRHLFSSASDCCVFIRTDLERTGYEPKQRNVLSSIPPLSLSLPRRSLEQLCALDAEPRRGARHELAELSQVRGRQSGLADL